MNMNLEYDWLSHPFIHASPYRDIFLFFFNNKRLEIMLAQHVHFYCCTSSDRVFVSNQYNSSASCRRVLLSSPVRFTSRTTM